MSTFKQLVDQVENNLQGYTLDQGEQTWLSAPMDADDLTIQVDEPALISRGTIQIDDELVWVKKVDNSSSTVTISPFGRGYQSSTAASHSVGARIVDSPKFPRHRIKETINTAIRELYPDVFPIKTTSLSFVAARNTYEMPAQAREVYSVSWEAVGPSRSWLSAKRWRFDPRADPTRFPSGKSLDIWSMVVPGRSVKVDYSVEPTVLSSDADVFSTVTGLDASAEETVIYGTCYRLVGWLETARLQMQAVEATARAPLVPPNSAIESGQYFYALYQQSLARARAKLLRENPTLSHFRYV